jgi:hypothetical protein
LALLFDRTLARARPSSAMRAAVGAGVLAFGGAAALASSTAGVYAAFVVVTAIARIKVIHFGVLVLAELPGLESARALPLVHAGGRLGGVVAGPLLALLGPRLGAVWLVGGAALLYAGGLLALRARDGAPPSVRSTESADAHDSRPDGLFAAIVLGAIALSLGRLALVTQSGTILEQAYGELDLNRVLGIYFTAANLAAFLLQSLVVGRVLGAGGLPLLNLGWSSLYLGAQLALSFGPPIVAVALAARLVESELRNALRTPVASLLYEAMAPSRRARARTWVIGVAVPGASVVGGLALGATEGHPGLLTALGVFGAAGVAVAAWAQNRSYRRVFPRR